MIDVNRYLAKAKFEPSQKQIEDQAMLIMDSIGTRDFQSSQLVFCKRGAVPEFPFDLDDEPLTYYEMRKEIARAIDIQRGIVIPEMLIVLPENIQAIRMSLDELDREFKSQRQIVICYWYKIPLVGILILKPYSQQILGFTPEEEELPPPLMIGDQSER